MLNEKVSVFLNYNILSPETVRAYKTDLAQFTDFFKGRTLKSLVKSDFIKYKDFLIKEYKPRTVNRKLSAVRKLLKFHGFIPPAVLQNIPFIKNTRVTDHSAGKKLLKEAFSDMSVAQSRYKMRNALRDAAVMTVLFNSGLKVNMLCSLRKENIDIDDDGTVTLHTEKKDAAWNESGVYDGLMERYMDEFSLEIRDCGYLFVNSRGNRFSDQDVRRMLKKYSSACGIEEPVSPSSFKKI